MSDEPVQETTPAGQDPAGAPNTESPRTYTAEEIKAVRDEAAAHRVKAREAEKRAGDVERRLKEIEDARKPELERLTESAGRVPVLEEKVARYEGVFAKVNEQTRKLLEGLDKSYLAVIPAGLDPDKEFESLRNAVIEIQKKEAKKPAEETPPEKPKSSLPPQGGRNPSTAMSADGEPTKEDRDAAGTVSTVVGRVIAGWSQPSVASAADKLLSVEL
jgi:hypothetical protein